MKHGSRETPAHYLRITVNISIFSSNRSVIALPHETDAPSPRRESPSRRLPLPGIGVHLPSQPQRRPGIALSQTRAGPRNRRPSVNRPGDDVEHRHGHNTQTPTQACTGAQLGGSTTMLGVLSAQPPSTRRALLSNLATQRVAVEDLATASAVSRSACVIC